MLLDRLVGYPAWSPDDTRIALELRGEKTHIGVLEIATVAVADLGEGYAPRWSPDGSRLAFVGGQAAMDIFVIDAAGANVRQLTDDPAFDTFPIWSPNGETILFLSAQTE